jgi:hypothetical protein
VAFTELELKRIQRTVGELCRRCSPPEHVEGHSVTVYEERPPWNGVGEWTRRGIARLRYYRSRRAWQLYWMRQDLRWHLYDPDEMPADLDSLVAVVETDKYGAFFG